MLSVAVYSGPAWALGLQGASQGRHDPIHQPVYDLDFIADLKVLHAVYFSARGEDLLGLQSHPPGGLLRQANANLEQIRVSQ